MENNIALFIDGYRLTNIDCSNKVLEGNPGIGGGEYITLSLAVLLSYLDKYSIFLYTPVKLTNLNNKIEQVIKPDLNESIYDFNTKKEGVFICCPRSSNDSFLDDKSLSINIICWEHCYFEYNILKKINKNPCISRVVCLTEEAKREKKLFPSIYKRSIVIGNFTNDINIKREFLNDNQIHFSFVGALVPVKGIHILTKWWPSLIKKIPNAHLDVYGSESMYFPNNKLGKYHLANENYEKIFLYPLLKRKVMNTVTFHGALKADELMEKLKFSSVGLVGISGVSETFCISAIDFGKIGIPVICRNVHGLKNTVPDQCGLRFNSKRDFIKKCVKIASDIKLNDEFGSNYVNFAKSFNQENFLKNWKNYISSFFLKEDINIPLAKRICSSTNRTFYNIKISFENLVFRIKWFFYRYKIYKSTTIKHFY